MDGRVTPGFNRVLVYRSPNTVDSPDGIPEGVMRVDMTTPEESSPTQITWLTESSRDVSPTQQSLESAQPQMSESPSVDFRRGPSVGNEEHKSNNASPETPNIRANFANSAKSR